MKLKYDLYVNVLFVHQSTNSKEHLECGWHCTGSGRQNDKQEKFPTFSELTVQWGMIEININKETNKIRIQY